ncbi:hypothetical protein C8R42DRAFT_730131 [Lentinula raphanica]|nr:hypothetical protein C8R42DRAFT_730131 [Lentinula raphanica]
MQTDNPNTKSTTSLLSTANTVASTVPLNPRQIPQKDYAAALGDLQSRYGYGMSTSHNPVSTPVVKQKDSSQASTSAMASKDDTTKATPGSDGPSTDGTKKKKRVLDFLRIGKKTVSKP